MFILARMRRGSDEPCGPYRSRDKHSATSSIAHPLPGQTELTTHADKPERVELLLATPEDEPVLSNLLQLYEYDFTEFLPLTLGSDGRFEYGSLSAYWTEPNRFPFIVRVDGRIAVSPS